MACTAFKTKTKASINLNGSLFLLIYQLETYHMTCAPGHGVTIQLRSSKAFRCGVRQLYTRGEDTWQNLVTTPLSRKK